MVIEQCLYIDFGSIAETLFSNIYLVLIVATMFQQSPLAMGVACFLGKNTTDRRAGL
jgi:hypothetical protein